MQGIFSYLFLGITAPQLPGGQESTVISRLKSSSADKSLLPPLPMILLIVPTLCVGMPH
jgi:hypothetical protein